MEAIQTYGRTPPQGEGGVKMKKTVLFLLLVVGISSIVYAEELVHSQPVSTELQQVLQDASKKSEIKYPVREDKRPGSFRVWIDNTSTDNTVKK